jgi:hypothetical protein
MAAMQNPVTTNRTSGMAADEGGVGIRYVAARMS